MRLAGLISGVERRHVVQNHSHVKHQQSAITVLLVPVPLSEATHLKRGTVSLHGIEASISQRSVSAP